MKKWFALITLVFTLTGCAYFSKPQHTHTEQEKLKSFLIVQDKLYIVGQLHDYQFENDLVTQLDRFLKSPYANQIKDIRIQFVTDGYQPADVEGEYGVFVSGDKLTPSDRAQLKAEFGFDDVSSNMMYRSYKANGKIVRLTNRNEILQKYRFKQPLEAKLIYEFYPGSEDKREAALAIASAPITIPLFIAKTLILLPFQIICFPLSCDAGFYDLIRTGINK